MLTKSVADRYAFGRHLKEFFFFFDRIMSWAYFRMSGFFSHGICRIRLQEKGKSNKKKNPTTFTNFCIASPQLLHGTRRKLSKKMPDLSHYGSSVLSASGFSLTNETNVWVL